MLVHPRLRVLIEGEGLYRVLGSHLAVQDPA